MKRNIFLQFAMVIVSCILAIISFDCMIQAASVNDVGLQVFWTIGLNLFFICACFFCYLCVREANILDKEKQRNDFLLKYEQGIEEKRQQKLHDERVKNHSKFYSLQEEAYKCGHTISTEHGVQDYFESPGSKENNKRAWRYQDPGFQSRQ